MNSDLRQRDQAGGISTSTGVQSFSPRSVDVPIWFVGHHQCGSRCQRSTSRIVACHCNRIERNPTDGILLNLCVPTLQTRMRGIFGLSTNQSHELANRSASTGAQVSGTLYSTV